MRAWWLNGVRAKLCWWNAGLELNVWLVVLSRRAELPALSSLWGSLARHASAGTWTACLLRFVTCLLEKAFLSGTYRSSLDHTRRLLHDKCMPAFRVFCQLTKTLRCGYLSFSVPNRCVVETIAIMEGQGGCCRICIYEAHTTRTHTACSSEHNIGEKWYTYLSQC